MRFPLAYPGISTVLVGAESAEHVRANLEATSAGPLNPRLQSRLEAWGRNRTWDFNP
jgi:aryl-alcohol dehydrogenase-like predicted oxidoreductase